jgi:hypothetical protein
MDLTRVKWLIGHLRQRTNFNRGAFDLRIIPIVNLNANFVGQRIEDRFAPALHFKLDDFQLYMNGSSPLDESKDPLNPLEIKIVEQFQQVPATLTVLGLNMRVENARWIAGVSIAVALVGLT